jgi:hypothetical protein
VTNEQQMYRQHKRMRVGTLVRFLRRRSAAPPRPSGPDVSSFNLSHDSNQRAQRTRVMADR